MAIKVQWTGNSQRLIHMTFDGEWDWRGFYVAAGNIVRMMVGTSHLVDIILDLRHTKPVATDFVFRVRLASFYRRNIGTIVLVQPTVAMREAARIAYPRKINHEIAGETLTASSIKEAEILIQQRRTQREARQPKMLRRSRLMSFLFD